MQEGVNYDQKLLNISPRQWEVYLKRHSHLPGPRANLELAKAFSRIGTLMDFKKFIELDHKRAQEDTPDEFLAFCGVLGFGQYLSDYHDSRLLNKLKIKANDPRPRIRDGVVMALRTIGQSQISRLLQYSKIWVRGTFLEQRAVVETFSDPDILSQQNVGLEVIELLDWATASMLEDNDRHKEEFKILENALSNSWSILVQAMPEKGKARMERWFKEDHPVIKQIMSDSLHKENLSECEPDWTRHWLQKI